MAIFSKFRCVSQRNFSKEKLQQNLICKNWFNCSVRYNIVFKQTNIVIYEKCKRMDFSMNNTLIESTDLTTQVQSIFKKWQNCYYSELQRSVVYLRIFFRLYLNLTNARKLECACLESQRIIPLKRNLTGQSQKLVAANYKKNRPSAKLG